MGWINATGTNRSKAGRTSIVLSVPVFRLFLDALVERTLAITEPTTTLVLHTSGTAAPYRSTALSSALLRLTRPVPGRVLLNAAHIKTGKATGTIALAHWSNFLLADRWLDDFSHFVLLAENSFLYRPHFEVQVRRTHVVRPASGTRINCRHSQLCRSTAETRAATSWQIDIERTHRIAVAPHTSKAERGKVKPCAWHDDFWQRVVFNNRSPHTSRAAKGMCECRSVRSADCSQRDCSFKPALALLTCLLGTARVLTASEVPLPQLLPSRVVASLPLHHRHRRLREARLHEARLLSGRALASDVGAEPH